MSVRYFTDRAIDEIKRFAGKQFTSGDATVSFRYHGIQIVNPWYDEKGCTPLSDEEAIQKYGNDSVLAFCRKAEERIRKNRELILKD